MKTILTLFAVLALAALVLVAAGGNSAGVAAQAAADRIVLVDGSVFPGTLVSVSDDWIEVEQDGLIMQLPWVAVRGDKLLNHRRRAIVAGNIPSLQRYLKWCRQQGMVKESAEAEVMLRRAGGSPERVPSVSQPERPDAPAVSNPSKPSEVSKPKPEAEKPRTTKRKAETWRLTEAKGSKVGVLEEVRGKMDTLSGKSVAKDKDADVVVELSGYKINTVKRVAWMGDLMYVILNGTLTAKITWKDGTTESKEFATGDRRSSKSDADATSMVHDDLVTDVWSWLKARIE